MSVFPLSPLCPARQNGRGHDDVSGWAGLSWLIVRRAPLLVLLLLLQLLWWWCGRRLGRCWAVCSLIWGLKFRGRREERLPSTTVNREPCFQPAAPDERSPEKANMKWMFKEDHSLGKKRGTLLNKLIENVCFCSITMCSALLREP